MATAVDAFSHDGASHYALPTLQGNVVGAAHHVVDGNFDQYGCLRTSNPSLLQIHGTGGGYLLVVDDGRVIAPELIILEDVLVVVIAYSVVLRYESYKYQTLHSTCLEGSFERLRRAPSLDGGSLVAELHNLPGSDAHGG